MITAEILQYGSNSTRQQLHHVKDTSCLRPEIQAQHLQVVCSSVSAKHLTCKMFTPFCVIAPIIFFFKHPG